MPANFNHKTNQAEENVLYFYRLLPICVLQSHDCLQNGPPDSGELIVVAMPNGQVANASFVRSHTNIYYQVRYTPASFMVGCILTVAIVAELNPLMHIWVFKEQLCKYD